MTVSENLSMSDVVQMVLVAETESKRILQEAQDTADQLLTDARRKAQAIVQTNRRETMQQVDALVAEAEQAAFKEKQERLAEAEQQIESAVQLEGPAAQSAIEMVSRCVCAERGSREG